MARVILNGTIVRYPLGGMSLWFMAYVVGFKRLGHETYFVEKSTWENSCYDVSKKMMMSDCTYGLSVIREIMKKYGMENHWCFVDEQGNYHGLPKTKINDIFNSADIYIDMEWGEWNQESSLVSKRFFLDGEPGWFQMKMMNLLQSGGPIPDYDFYFTGGKNIGKVDCTVPLAGIEWHHNYQPILPDDTITTGVTEESAFTTIMNWNSNKDIEYNGKKYGQKSMEFEKFLDLPTRTNQKLEVAISGSNVPRQRLTENGWQVKSADHISESINSYLTYIANSKGEFSVAKNVYVETQCGHLADRAGYYLYYGKPVVQQETGFSKHLPCGLGLFAVKNSEEAATALESICRNYKKHSTAAHEIAIEYFTAEKVVKKFIDKI